MSDLANLETQLADLQAKVAALRAPAPLPTPPAPVEVVPRPVRLHTLVGSVEMGYLSRNPRTVRQLAEAVAFCRSAPSPAQEVPADWVPQMRALAKARAASRSWRDALTEAGLEVPADLSTQAQAVRVELDGIWGRLLPLTGLVLDSVNSIAKDNLVTFLKRALA